MLGAVLRVRLRPAAAVVAELISAVGAVLIEAPDNLRREVGRLILLPVVGVASGAAAAAMVEMRGALEHYSALFECQQAVQRGAAMRAMGALHPAEADAYRLACAERAADVVASPPAQHCDGVFGLLLAAAAADAPFEAAVRELAEGAAAEVRCDSLTRQPAALLERLLLEPGGTASGTGGFAAVHGLVRCTVVCQDAAAVAAVHRRLAGCAGLEMASLSPKVFVGDVRWPTEVVHLRGDWRGAYVCELRIVLRTVSEHMAAAAIHWGGPLLAGREDALHRLMMALTDSEFKSAAGQRAEQYAQLQEELDRLRSDNAAVRRRWRKAGQKLQLVVGHFGALQEDKERLVREMRTRLAESEKAAAQREHNLASKYDTLLAQTTAAHHEQTPKRTGLFSCCMGGGVAPRP